MYIQSGANNCEAYNINFLIMSYSVEKSWIYMFLNRMCIQGRYTLRETFTFSFWQ